MFDATTGNFGNLLTGHGLISIDHLLQNTCITFGNPIPDGNPIHAAPFPERVLDPTNSAYGEVTFC